MMNDKVFGLIRIVIIAVAACVLFYLFTQAIMTGNQQYYDLVNKCIENSGVWINHTYQCIRK